MLTNLNFSDFTTELDGGFPAGTSLSVGSNSGTVIKLLGTGVRKLRFCLSHCMGSASGVLQFYLQTATASNGTFASLSQTLASVAVSIASSTSTYKTVIDTRGETLNAGYVQVVAVIAGVAMTACMDVLGYNVRDEPGKAQNAATFVYNEVIAMQ
jgi:hypothetical protein